MAQYYPFSTMPAGAATSKIGTLYPAGEGVGVEDQEASEVKGDLNPLICLT